MTTMEGGWEAKTAADAGWENENEMASCRASVEIEKI